MRKGQRGIDPEHTASGCAAILAPILSLQHLQSLLAHIHLLYNLALRLPHAPILRPLLTDATTVFLLPFPPSSSSLRFRTLLALPHLMPVDTVVDLRQRAGDLAHRLGSLSHFMPAAQELLEIIHHLTSEILLRHNRKVGSELIRSLPQIDVHR